jgi:hypothetical protein
MSKILPFPLKGKRPAGFEYAIECAVEVAAERYFDDCRLAVPGFIDRHFNYPGALSTNRVALGWDMLRAPVNLFWAPIYALICVLKWLLRLSVFSAPLASQLDRIPAGLTTQVQQHISDLIRDDLLCHGQSGHSLDDYLMDSLQTVYEQHTDKVVNRHQFQRMIEPLVAEALSEYQLTRTASADISNSLSCTILGAFAFQKFTPGGIGIAILLASLLAESSASRGFLLGETLGSVYYGWFPPEPSSAMFISVMAGVMALLAAIAALSGLIIDPMQAATGLHRRRLHNMLDHLQRDFAVSSRSSYRPKDQFIARIMDTFDVIKSGLV